MKRKAEVCICEGVGKKAMTEKMTGFQHRDLHERLFTEAMSQ